MTLTAISILKAVHVIGFVAWFAGLFYLVRLFIYHVEAEVKPAQEKDILQNQFKLMEQRVYKIIVNPSMMLTWTAGITMLIINPSYLSSENGTPGWMHLKLTLLVVLLAYHLYCKRIMKNLDAGKNTFSPFQLRLFNEVPTLFLVTISFIAVLGKAGILNYAYLGIGILAFAGIVYLGAKSYQKRRMSN